MNRKHAITVATLLGLLLALLVFVEYPKLKKIEKRGPAYESVAAELPGDIDRVAATINANLQRMGGF